MWAEQVHHLILWASDKMNNLGKLSADERQLGKGALLLELDGWRHAHFLSCQTPRDLTFSSQRPAAYDAPMLAFALA